ncbi:MAG: hypothetical protein ACI4MF_01160 [Candidatus Faecivicinus sp.]
MPHYGISWFRLKEHFRKYLAIYIVGLIICVLLTNLVYTSTAPRTPYDQEVLIYLADAYTNPEPLDDLAADALAYAQEFDETLLEVNFESLQYVDPEQDYTSSMLLMARLSLGEADVFLASGLCMEALCACEAFLPLDDYLAEGWMEEFALEPYLYTSEETGETFVAGLKLDSVSGLAEIGAFNNEGAVLVITANSTNTDTSMQAAEYIIRQLTEGDYVSTHRPEQEA